MLEYDRTDISEEIDVYKTSASKECDICNLLSNKQRRDIKQSKNIMKVIKKDQESKQKISAETYLKKTKTKRENMEKTDTAISLKKKKKY